ncbi:MAG: hypothetical protein PHW01_00220 [Patescibacteria group bacterium]|nr:hypothetical protein [Patescibacteria group bacterium]
MNSATKQRKEAMKIFTKIRVRNKSAKQWEITRDVKKAIKAIRRTNNLTKI